MIIDGVSLPDHPSQVEHCLLWWLFVDAWLQDTEYYTNKEDWIGIIPDSDWGTINKNIDNMGLCPYY